MVDTIYKATTYSALPANSTLSALDSIYNVMQYENKRIFGLYPQDDLIADSKLNYGMSQERVKTVSLIASNIMKNLTSQNQTTYNTSQSTKLSQIISTVGLELVKAQFPSNNTQSITTE